MKASDLLDPTALCTNCHHQRHYHARLGRMCRVASCWCMFFRGEAPRNMNDLCDHCDHCGHERGLHLFYEHDPSRCAVRTCNCGKFREPGITADHIAGVE